MKRLSKIAVAVLSLAGTLLFVRSATAQDPVSEREQVSASGKEKDQQRILNGNARDKSGNPLPGAVVYLKNTKTLAVKTYIAENDGGFHFHSLSPNVDYEVYAEFNGQRSSTKMLSSFDSRNVVTMELKIDANK
ncbi:MAG: hypothetical protein JWO13_1518 [Acidobacteriales bacterium]|nr:hypothetical protein [Terriglobales bacterium]